MALAGYDDFDARQGGVPAPPMAALPAPPSGAMVPNLGGVGGNPLSDMTNRPPHASDDAAVPPPPVPPAPQAPVLSNAPMSDVSVGVGTGVYGSPAGAPGPAPMPSMSGPASPFSSMGTFGTMPKRPEDDPMMQQLLAALGGGR